MRCLLALLVSTMLFAQPASAQAELAVTHVTVIDGRGAPLADMSVLLQGTRIAAVAPAAALALPPGTQIVDGRGRFLIPGLWDMHVHLMRPGRPETYFPLYIANGITGVRDMGGELPLAEIARIKQDIADGRRLGPRIVAAGPLVDGPYPVLPHISRVVSDAASASATVRELAAQGADFIKVYNRCRARRISRLPRRRANKACRSPAMCRSRCRRARRRMPARRASSICSTSCSPVRPAKTN